MFATFRKLMPGPRQSVALVDDIMQKEKSQQNKKTVLLFIGFS